MATVGTSHRTRRSSSWWPHYGHRRSAAERSSRPTIWPRGANQVLLGRCRPRDSRAHPVPSGPGVRTTPRHRRRARHRAARGVTPPGPAKYRGSRTARPDQNPAALAFPEHHQTHAVRQSWTSRSTFRAPECKSTESGWRCPPASHPCGRVRRSQTKPRGTIQPPPTHLRVHSRVQSAPVDALLDCRCRCIRLRHVVGGQALEQGGGGLSEPGSRWVAGAFRGAPRSARASSAALSVRSGERRSSASFHRAAAA